MRLNKGQATYMLRPFHEIVHVALVAEDAHYVLQRTSVVGPAENPPGRPTHFVVSLDREITFDRAPDKAYRVEITYLPPMRIM